jgi:hypothetical protein
VGISEDHSGNVDARDHVTPLGTTVYLGMQNCMYHTFHSSGGTRPSCDHNDACAAHDTIVSPMNVT